MTGERNGADEAAGHETCKRTRVNPKSFTDFLGIPKEPWKVGPIPRDAFDFVAEGMLPRDGVSEFHTLLEQGEEFGNYSPTVGQPTASLPGPNITS